MKSGKLTKLPVPLSLPEVDPVAGLSYHTQLFAKTFEKGTVQAWNISFDAENTAITPSVYSPFQGEPGVPRTHLDAESIPANPKGVPPDEVLMFYQTQGDDITMYSGSLSSDDWTESTLPIPDE